VARHCRAEGAEVAIFEYDEGKVDGLREEFGDDVLVVQGDVRSIEDLQACRAAIEQRWGRLRSIIGAQGIFEGNLPIVDTRWRSWRPFSRRSSASTSPATC
jgi:NAD(P)-dependent dehydrogenase (short-subunit alcohol dehydrogenase family)